MAYTTIDKPTDYFNTKLYTGNGSTQSITGVGFQPDWVWLKSRSSADSHALYDSVRGTQKILQSDRTNAEISQSNGLSAFGSDGFTIGDNSQINTSSGTFVSWNWLAGTSASGNTTGSGTAQSYTESYSTTAGFSIIAFTGNGTANHTLPHNLGVAPDWFFIKKRIGTGDATVRDWNVYHSSLGNTKRMVLNTTASVTTSNEYWNNTSPTSSVINLGTNDQINGNNNTYICYAFAEKKGYSKFGTYVGNANTNGPFVYTGFRPAWIMIKATDAAKSWYMWDSKRAGGFNLVDDILLADTTDSEFDGSNIDILSNGFKFRSSGSGEQGSGTNYIYMAFAEFPFVSSGGIPCTAR